MIVDHGCRQNFILIPLSRSPSCLPSFDLGPCTAHSFSAPVAPPVVACSPARLAALFSPCSLASLLSLLLQFKVVNWSLLLPRTHIDIELPYTPEHAIPPLLSLCCCLFRNPRESKSPVFVFFLGSPLLTWSSRSPRLLSSTASFGSKFVISCNQTDPGGHSGQASIWPPSTIQEQHQSLKNVLEIDRLTSWVLLWYREQAFY